MIKYTTRRILLIIPILLGIIFIIMGIMTLIPGSPGLVILGPDAPEEAVDELNEKLGYDKPFLNRYITYISELLRGNLGDSYRTGRPVLYEVGRRLPTSFKLAIFGVGVAMLIGIPLGILSSVKQYSKADVFLTTLAMVLNSMPTFWFGLMLIILFSLKLGMLPSIGLTTPAHYILPVAALASYTVIFRHALGNALLPVITYAGMAFGKMVGGVVAVETVFSIDGVGNMVLTAIRNKDVALVTGGIVCLASIYMIVLLFVDILYAIIDPRVRQKYLNIN